MTATEIAAYTGAAVAVGTALGGGVRWLLTWVFGELAKARADYVQALERIEDRHAAEESQLRLELDQRRDAHLADKDRHARSLEQTVESLRQALGRIGASRRPPPPSSPSNG